MKKKNENVWLSELDENSVTRFLRVTASDVDLAEAKAEDEIPMTIEAWAKQFEGLILRRLPGNTQKLNTVYSKVILIGLYWKWRIWKAVIRNE